MTDKKQVDNLEDCRKAVEQLEEENRHLRQAAGVFGKLAERLNVTLREERRHEGDRRRDLRPTADRRGSTPEGEPRGNGEDS